MSIQLKPWEKYSEQGAVILLFSIFLLPFVVNSNFYFPFITPRNFILRIVIGMALALAIMLFVSRPKRYAIPKHPILVSFVVLVATLTLSSIINGDFAYSFWSTYERMDGLVNFYHIILLLIILLALFKTEKDWLSLIRFTTFVSFLIGFIAIAQKLDVSLVLQSGGGDRVSSTLGNATYLATYALFHIFFAGFLLTKRFSDNFKFEFILLILMDAVILITEVKFGVLRTVITNGLLLTLFIIPHVAVALCRFAKKEHLKTKGKQLFYLSILVINFVALFNTQTRGAFVGLVISFFIMLITSLLFLKKRRIKNVILLVLIATIALGGSVFYFNDAAIVQNTPTLNRISKISLTDATTRSRILTWETSFKGWKEKPILGWGEERFHVVFNKYFPQEIYRHVGSRVWFDRPHNVFLQPLIHGGIIAFGAYMSIFFFAFLSLWKYIKRTEDTKAGIILGGLIIAYMIQNAFVFDSLNSYILFVLLFGYIIFLTSKKEATEEESPRLKRPPIILLVIILIGTYYLNVPFANANKANVEALFKLNSTYSDKEAVIEAAEEFVQTINQTYLGKFEIRQTFAEQVSGVIEQKSLPDDISLELGRLAEAELQKNIEEQPDNVRHYAFLTSLYLNMSSLDKSIIQKNLDLLEKAIVLSPTRTHLYYSRGRSYINLQKRNEAVQAFQKAVELSPKVFDAHLNLFAAYATFEEDDKALALIEGMTNDLERPISAQELSRLAEIYQLLQRLPVAITILNNAIENFPNEAELQKQIAVYYIGIGDTENALRSAEKALELEPSFAEEFSQFKKQIDSL